MAPHDPEAVLSRERILAAALHVFAEYGYEGAATREVARRAGVRQGLLSYYFAGKSGLWRAVVEGAFERLRQAAEAARPLPPGDVRQRLRDLLLRAVELAVAEPELLRLLAHEAASGGERLRWLHERHLEPLQGALQARLSPLSGAEALLVESALVGFLAETALCVGLDRSGAWSVSVGARVERFEALLQRLLPSGAAVPGPWSLPAARARARAQSPPMEEPCP